jgi:hypothetical protein
VTGESSTSGGDGSIRVAWPAPTLVNVTRLNARDERYELRWTGNVAARQAAVLFPSPRSPHSSAVRALPSRHPHVDAGSAF